MSIRDRLRPSSSVLSPSNPSIHNAANNDDVRLVTGVALSCDDMSNEGDVHREYTLVRGVHRTVDFVRATLVHPSGHISVAADGAARATFSSPVMSRRHARITFAEDGSVTVMDVGSMHGTYLEGVNFRDFFPERLKPRRHYTLRSGDTLLLGKSIMRDDRDWKPVTLRVTFMHDAAARYATPPPNRYGMYINSAGVSELDEDTDCLSSSSGGEDNDSRGLSGSSPDSSPVISHVPLPLDRAPSASASFESLASGSRNADDGSPNRGVFDLNRTASARNVLRAMLPPLPTIQLPAIRRLPSLRELGFFGGVSNSRADTNEEEVDDGQAPNPEHDTEEADTIIHISTSLAPPNSYQDAVPSANTAYSAGAEEEETSGSIFGEPEVVPEEEVSGSIFAWQEPSHPQNQLGLELSDHGSFYVEHHEDEGDEDGDYSYDSSESADADADQGGEVKKVDEVQHDDEKSMEISPSTSRGGSPSFRARAVFDANADVDELDLGPAELEGQQHCHCHDQEEEPGDVEQEEEREQVHGYEQRPVEEVPAVVPVTPGSQSTSLGLGFGSPLDEEHARRRARAARFGFSYNPTPLSPISISRRGKRVGSRFGPVRRSTSPNPAVSTELAGWPYIEKSIVSNQAPDMNLLRARVRSLEARMEELREGEGALMAGPVATSSASASASASTSAAATSVDEARKEMELMREEMRRLSGLIEILMAKIDARASESVRVERGVQADEPQSREELLSTHGRFDSPLPVSRKRKRMDDICTIGTRDLEAERLIVSLNSQVGRPLAERIQEFHEPIDQPEVRPAKRTRTGAESAAMTVVAAAGYTGLGAALAWATLAYVL